MYKAFLKLKCERPEIVVKSLENETRNDSDSRTELGIEDKFVTIHIESKKLSHLKAIVNSYISIVAALNEVEKLE